MKVLATGLDGVLVFRPTPFRDDRGFFSRTFDAAIAAEHGVDHARFLQETVLVPPGFLVGFQVLTEQADVCYRIDRLHVEAESLAVRHDDPDLRITWPRPVTGLSRRDLQARSWADLPRVLTANTASGGDLRRHPVSPAARPQIEEIVPAMPSDPTPAISCRFCCSHDGAVVLDAGQQPASDHFPLQAEPGPDPVHPLRMWLCAGCHLAQLIEDPTVPEEPRGQEPEALLRQAEEAVADMAAAGFLEPGRVVTEYGSPHGGGWIDILTARGLRLATPDRPVDVIVDNIGMMHDRDQAAGLAERVARLAPDGVLLFQFHSLAAIITGGQWNALRHGHYAYYSTPALVGMLDSVGLTTTTAFRYPLYGGTVLLAATRNGTADDSVRDLIAQERAAGVLDPQIVRGLQHACASTADELAGLLAAEKAAGRTVLGYSAASRSVALLNRAGIGPDLMPAVADASPAKLGRRLPGSAIRVISPADLVEARPDTVILFVPDLLPEVRAAMPQIEARGGRWLVAGELPGFGPIPETMTSSCQGTS